MSKIYISSTFNDLADHRTAVIRALRQMNKIVVAMEDYTASDERPFDRCLADVAACDVYVGIFAHCYGFIPIANNPDRLSITELELRQAEVLGKQKFIFLVDETARWSPLNMDVHTKQGDSGTRVAELRDRLSHTTMVRFFDGPDDLATSVTTAVARWQEQQHEVAALSAEATFARRGARSIAGAREEDGGGWSVEPTPAQVMTTAPLPLPDKPSLAVLPFQNLSGDPEQEYFVDGVVEDIITALSRTGWLFVIARNSSFTYKGQAHDIRRVGRDLGVRYVLEGSIRRASIHRADSIRRGSILRVRILLASTLRARSGFREGSTFPCRSFPARKAKTRRTATAPGWRSARWMGRCASWVRRTYIWKLPSTRFSSFGRWRRHNFATRTVSRFAIPC